MAKETEDVLGELYAWDSAIDDVFALDESDPSRDEDDALDAYEEVIQLASQPEDGADSVLSLAAQLLTKHFFKFPHVHMNVVDVMLVLCSAERPQAVRIHTIRSLLQIVKTPTSEAEPVAKECLDRISEVVGKLVERETSGVIMRHMTQLAKALKEKEEAAALAAAEEDKLAKRKNAKAEKLKKRTEKAAAAAVERDLKKASTAQSVLLQPVAKDGESDREKRSQRGRNSDDHDHADNAKGKHEDRRSKDESDLAKKEDDKKKRHDRIEEVVPRSQDTPRAAAGGFHSQSCPPGPYLFIGNVPFDIRNSDIAEFLSEVDPTMKSSCVQIKYPPRGGSGYAFVSLPSTQLAREAIRFVSKAKFQGRYMNGNFARGPPCGTLSFVERSGKGRNMEDDDAVRDFNFAKCNRSVWDRLCDALRGYGDLEIVETGKVRFRDVENAKDVIRKHHFTIQGFEIIPIYEPEEQLKNDNTRTRQVQTTRQGFALKSGRVVGDVDSNAHGDRHNDRGRAGDRQSDKNDRNGRRSDDRSESRKRSPSPKTRGSNKNPSRSRSVSPTSTNRKQEKQSTRDRVKSRSRSPGPASKKQLARPRSKSRSTSSAPTRKQGSRGRSKSRSRSPVPPSRKQKKDAPTRSASRSNSPAPARKQEIRTRPRSPVPTRKQDVRSRSRSPVPASPPGQKVISQHKQQHASRSRSRSPGVDERKPISRRDSPPVDQRVQLDNRGGRSGPPERAQPRRTSRSRSGERSHFGVTTRDVSSYGPGRRGDGGNGGRPERGPRSNDQPFDHPRPPPERRESGGRSSGGGMARYGPAGPASDRNSDLRDDRRHDRSAPNRDYRDSPQPQKQSLNSNHEQPRNEQRRRSRSRHGVDRARSQSPHNRRPADVPQRVFGDNGPRGRDNRTLERNNGSRRDDDRSIAEIARDEQEKQRQQQQNRRESYPTGHLSRYGDGGKAESYSTPPPRDGRQPSGGGFQKNRSRSPGRPVQQHRQSRRNDLPRDRPLSPPRAAQPSDYSRGNGVRDSPQVDRKRERRDSDIGRPERRGRSPPPSPFMKTSNRPASPPPMDRNRVHGNPRGHEDDRDRKRNHNNRRDAQDRSQKEQNRNGSNSQRNDRSRDRPQKQSPVLDSPPSGKRLRSLTPSPVRRDSYKKKTDYRERSRSPILKRSIERENEHVSEKKRRVDDEDRVVVPKSTSAVFDDMDETMVDYDEDDD